MAEDGRNTDVLKEDLKNTTSLFVDKTRNTLHTTSTSKTTDGRLSDTCATISGPKDCIEIESHTLNVITKNFAMALSSTLSESLSKCKRQIKKLKKETAHLAAFSASRHDDLVVGWGGWW